LIQVSHRVREALAAGRPVVALESTVLAHGLPRPRNLEVGRAMEAEVEAGGAVPATVALLAGVPTVGLDGGRAGADRAHRRRGEALHPRPAARRRPRRRDGATTVASTLWLASRAGVEVFATGGIGGVHRGEPRDVSADLTELSRTPMIVVCAGAKSILDLPATREALETAGVLVLGWRTTEFPAFYTPDSGLEVDVRVESAEEVAGLWRAQRGLGLSSSLLLCVPPPAAGLAAEEAQRAIDHALAGAEAAGVRGKAVTPYLLGEVARLTGGRSLEANVGLLRNNARVAAGVAAALAAS
jgi:pseudouridylate synthase